jgi:structural maintenance of chromosome 3 (chondroitin sulfate proteoglycan 6)
LKITDLSERLILISKEKTLRESEKTSFEELLIKSLIPRRRKLLRDISSLNHEDLLEKINQVKQDLSISKLLLEESEDSSAKTGDRYEEISESIRELQNNFEDLKKKEDSLREQIRGESNSINKILNNRSILLQKKEKCVKNIRELGSIPSNALQLCKGKSDDVLLQELDKINEQLKKFSHVNKKAFEQFLQSSEQQKTLLDKLNEVDSGKGSIEDLIQHLDLKKDEAIRTTFKSIAKNFSIVFSELVPGGKAQLVIQKSGNHANEGEASDEEDVESERVDEKVEVDEDDTEEGKENSSKAYAEQYVGINFRVAFPGSREVVSMNQLSGGQQTVVALSLIFAIQRCDPSPFYLFDEIDSNLDAVYRTAVANMISKQSEEGIQFICTTFRSEITQVADKCFGVVYENKVSRVDEISSDDARNIIFEVEREVEQ